MPFNKIASMPNSGKARGSNESVQNESSSNDSAKKRLPVLLSEDNEHSEDADIDDSLTSRLLGDESEANLAARLKNTENRSQFEISESSNDSSPLHVTEVPSNDIIEVQSVGDVNKLPGVTVDDVTNISDSSKFLNNDKIEVKSLGGSGTVSNGTPVCDSKSIISDSSNILSLLSGDNIDAKSIKSVKDRLDSAKFEGVPNNNSASLTEHPLVRQDSICEVEGSTIFSVKNEKLGNGFLNVKSSPALSHKSTISQNSKAEFYIGDYDSMSPCNNPKEDNDNFFVRKTPRRRVQISDTAKGPPRRKAPEFTPPDGGYGWVIAFSACVVNAFNLGVIKSYGVLYVAIAKKFPEASAYQASWLPVLLSTIGLLTAPIIGFLCRKFTSRKVSFVGSLVSFSGLLLGAYARSMTELILSFGLLAGLGNGLTSTPGVLITSLYFEERRGIASAICVSGNAIGGFLFPPLISYLLSEYDFEGAMLILSAMMLNMCAASLLYRPIRVHALIQQRKRLKQMRAYKNSTNQENKYIEEMGTSSPALFKSASLRRRVTRARMISECSTVDEDELHRQVSFMRSSSMMSSIPDLNHYARSWNINNNPPPPPQSTTNPPPRVELTRRPSRRYSVLGSKLSLTNITNIVAEKASQDLDKGAVTWISAIERVKHVNSQNSLGSIMGSTDSRKQSLSRQISRPYSDRPISPLDPIYDEEAELDQVADDLVENLLNQSIASTIDSNMNVPPRGRGPKVFVVRLPSESKEEEQKEGETEVEQPRRCLSCCSSFLDCSLMKNHKFLMMALTVMLFAGGAPHAIFFLPAHATDIGIESAKVISLLSISSIIDLFGRLGIGFLADLKVINNSVIYGISAAMAGVSILFIPFVESYVGMGICVGVYGFGVGAWFVMIPTILAKNHGSQRLAASFGLVRMFQGIMNFSSPQISGLLIDASKSYGSTYLFMGSTMLIGGLIMMMEPIISKTPCLRNRREY